MNVTVRLLDILYYLVLLLSPTFPQIFSALCLSSLLLLAQGAPAPIFDPVLAAITGSFATPLALSGGLVAAEGKNSHQVSITTSFTIFLFISGLTLGATIPTWLLALKAGLFGKMV